MPQDKPVINLNLDTLEREGAPKKPFAVVLGGKRYQLVDAIGVDFRRLIASQLAFMTGDAKTAISLVLKEEDVEPFFANDIGLFKLQRLFEDYSDYYGMTPVGEANGSPLT